ncbi:MAG: SIMPL domain-containing protein [Candidatus Binatia bacterium]
MMRRLGIQILIGALFLPTLAPAQTPVVPPRTLAVNGEAEVKVAPDLAVISFAVETAAPTAGAAVGENAKKSAALADAIKQKLGPKDKVFTTQYALHPVYEQRERPTTAPPRITGYIASNAVRAELHAVGDVGALIDAATAAGANRVDNLDFTLEERAAAQTQALQRAGQDARRQAEAAAAALGVKLGRVLTASTGGSPIIIPKSYARDRGMVAMAESRPPTPVEAGDVTVTATILVSYEIE